MEDDLNFKENRSFSKMEDDINFSFFVNGRRLQCFGRMEDDFILLAKWKTTSILREKEEDLN